MKSKKKGTVSTLKWFTLLCACLFCSSSFAVFDVLEEDTEGYYGNAEIRPFKDVIDGQETLTSRDRAFLNSVEETRVTERNFVRVLVGRPRVKMLNITNKSSVPNDIYQVAKPTITDNIPVLLLAGGHVWEMWGLELELFLSKKLHYDAAPFLVSRTESFSATIQQYALLLNGQFILPRWVSFYPRRLQLHLDAGGGPVVKSTNATSMTATGTVVATNSKRNLALVGMLGAGARYQVAPHLLVEFAYRYFNLGKTKFGNIQVGATENMIFQSNQTRSTGLFVGLMYQV